MNFINIAFKINGFKIFGRIILLDGTPIAILIFNFKIASSFFPFLKKAAW